MISTEATNTSITSTTIAQFVNYGLVASHDELAVSTIILYCDIAAGYYYFHEDTYGHVTGGTATVGYPGGGHAIVEEGAVIFEGPSANDVYTASFANSYDWEGFLPAGHVGLTFGSIAGDNVQPASGAAFSTIYFGMSPVPEISSLLVVSLAALTILLRKRIRMAGL